MATAQDFADVLSESFSKIEVIQNFADSLYTQYIAEAKRHARTAYHHDRTLPEDYISNEHERIERVLVQRKEDLRKILNFEYINYKSGENGTCVAVPMEKTDEALCNQSIRWIEEMLSLIASESHANAYVRWQRDRSYPDDYVIAADNNSRWRRLMCLIQLSHQLGMDYSSLQAEANEILRQDRQLEE